MKPPQESHDFPNAFYRVAVKGLCVQDGKILMTYDTSENHIADAWELPGGGLDFGENFHDALRREVQEEMGLEVKSISEKPIYVWTINHGKGRGMDWYHVLALVFKLEFKNLNFTPTEECKEIKFFSIEELRAMLPQVSRQIRPLAEHFNPKDFII